MEQIEYTRTVVPSSMRSPYWKYFGFPSDNGNNILTRQKIICTICNTAIAYNKNTSNLRTHLMSKHVEIFQKVVIPTNDVSSLKQQHKSYRRPKKYFNRVKKMEAISTRNSTTNNAIDNNNSGATRNRIETIVEDVTECLQNKNNSAVDLLSNTSVLKNDFELEIERSEYITFLPSNDFKVEKEPVYKTFSTNNEINNTERNEEKKITNREDNLHKEQLHSADVMLADLIQTDLLPLYTLEDRGFCKYNHLISGVKLDDNIVKRVVEVIEKRFTNVKEIVTNHVRHLSHSLPYSLSFEVYKDNEEQEILNIYFNYLESNKMDFISILYTSKIICNKFLNIADIFSDINLKNCSGVVVTCLSNVLEFILDFTKTHDLPLVECLESMMTRCLQKIFRQTEFHTDYEKLIKVVLEINNQAQYVKRPNFNKQRNEWSRWNFLEYIFQNVEDNKLEEYREFRQSFEYLKPLKVAIDIITDEPLPLCSLIRPLIKKLFEDHFNSLNQDEPRISNMRKILETELHERVMINYSLNEITFFDLRFHRDFALQEPFSINNLKTEVARRFRHMQETCVNNPNNSVIFENSMSLKTTSVDIINLDLEIEKYQNQTCLDLYQSSVLWWQQQSEPYKILSKLAKRYLSIPCCCLPRLSKIDLEQRYSKLDRRKNLSQFCNTESKLWYLHYNEGVAELIL